MPTQKPHVPGEIPLKARIISASKWSALSELAAKAITPLVYVLLARLLTPADFGVVSAAAVVVSFSQIFWDAGLSKALIQREDSPNEAANVVFWSNVALSLVIYAILFFAAEWIALLFQDPRVTTVLRVQGIQIILVALSSVQTALYQRKLNFRPLFWVRLFTTVGPGLASIPLAYAGFGYWALVAGTLFGSILQLIVLWLTSPWRPNMSYDLKLARNLTHFGLWAAAEGLLGWFYLWADALIVGAYLGPHDLGLYRTGNSLVLMVFGLLLSPLMPVLFSSLSRMQGEPERLSANVLGATKFFTILALPVGFGAFYLREPLATMVFDDRWTGVAIVIGTLAISHGLSWIVAANSEAYRAIGRPDVSVKLMFFCFVYYLPAYIFSAPRGLTVFLYTRLALTIITIPIHILLGYKLFSIAPKTFFYNITNPIVATASMVTAIAILIQFAGLQHNNIFHFTIIIAMGVFVYFFALVRERTFLIRIWRIATKKT